MAADDRSVEEILNAAFAPAAERFARVLDHIVTSAERAAGVPSPVVGVELPDATDDLLLIPEWKLRSVIDNALFASAPEVGPELRLRLADVIAARLRAECQRVRR